MVLCHPQGKERPFLDLIGSFDLFFREITEKILLNRINPVAQVCPTVEDLALYISLFSLNQSIKIFSML